jgi:hypothetical protein
MSVEILGKTTDGSYKLDRKDLIVDIGAYDPLDSGFGKKNCKCNG